MAAVNKRRLTREEREAFEDALDIVLRHTDAQGRKGVVACIAPEGMSRDTDLSYAQEAIGEVNPSKLERYNTFSFEKNWRLDQHPEHLGSAQSANEAAEQYPGAIRVGRELYSTSGLPSGAADETICLLAAVRLRRIDQAEAFRIASTTGNDLYLGIVGIPT